MATDTFDLQSMAKLRAVVLTACSFAATAFGAGEPQRQAVDTIRPLLMQAVVSGSAHGVMVGAMASGFAEAFGSTAPIEVDVSRVHPLAQEGCARLRVTTRQSGVHVASAPSLAANQSLAYEISYCQDGTFPSDGHAAR